MTGPYFFKIRPSCSHLFVFEKKKRKKKKKISARMRAWVSVHTCACVYGTCARVLCTTIITQYVSSDICPLSQVRPSFAGDGRTVHPVPHSCILVSSLCNVVLYSGEFFV